MPYENNSLSTKTLGVSQTQDVLYMMFQEPWSVESVTVVENFVYVKFFDGPKMKAGWISTKYADLADKRFIAKSWKITGGDPIMGDSDTFEHRLKYFGLNIHAVEERTFEMNDRPQKTSSVKSMITLILLFLSAIQSYGQRQPETIVAQEVGIDYGESCTMNWCHVHSSIAFVGEKSPDGYKRVLYEWEALRILMKGHYGEPEIYRSVINVLEGVEDRNYFSEMHDAFIDGVAKLDIVHRYETPYGEFLLVLNADTAGYITLFVESE